ncbi:MAG TPA: FtsX-like permease family protein [Steroidobacteraceae bacterium]|nr:FtsX-like permease family protein [Steroidobacteraceae bacterium]
MRYWSLVWSALWRKPAEAILVWLAVTVSFALFGLMVGLHATYQQLIDNSRLDRLYVNARFPSANPTGILLPLALRDAIMRVDGVAEASAVYYVRGYYRDPHVRATVYAVDEHMRAAWPELPLTSAQWAQLRATPNGVFVTHNRAMGLGLKTGDRLPIITSQAFTPPGLGARADGALAWQFQVLGIVPDMPGAVGVGSTSILGNLSYVDNSRPADARGYAWEYRVAVRDPTQANEIAVRIDAATTNSGTPTLTIPDKIAEIDGVNAGISVASKTWPIAGAGIFMILLLTANGLAQSVRERAPEFAVLKTVGYRQAILTGLVFAEGAIPCVVGAALGMGLAMLMTRLPIHFLPADLLSLPKPTLSLGVLSVSLACALLLALLGAAIPLRRLRHLSVTDTLAGR